MTTKDQMERHIKKTHGSRGSGRRSRDGQGEREPPARPMPPDDCNSLRRRMYTSDGGPSAIRVDPYHTDKQSLSFH